MSKTDNLVFRVTFSLMVFIVLSSSVTILGGNAFAQSLDTAYTNNTSSNGAAPDNSSTVTAGNRLTKNNVLENSSVPKPSIYGEWLPPDRDVVIRIQPCEAASQTLCAELIRHAYANLSTKDVLNPNPALRDRPLDGVGILANVKAKGRDSWKGGKLYDPRTGKSYYPKLKLIGPDMIKLTGCIGPGLCKGYIWERVTQDVTLIAQDLEKVQRKNATHQ